MCVCSPAVSNEMIPTAEHCGACNGNSIRLINFMQAHPSVGIEYISLFDFLQ